MPGKKLTRREREKIRQRREMLDAALELFSEKGFHNVSVHEIAQEAEFAIGTLYKFFGNKEELYKALMLDVADRFHDALNEALDTSEDEIEKLRNYVKTIGSVFMDNAPVIRLYYAETSGTSFNIKAGLESEMRQRHQDFLQTIAAVFESGMQKASFRRIAEPYHLAMALDSLCHAFLFGWLETPDQHPYPENPDMILDIFFKGLVDP